VCMCERVCVDSGKNTRERIHHLSYVGECVCVCVMNSLSRFLSSRIHHQPWASPFFDSKNGDAHGSGNGNDSHYVSHSLRHTATHCNTLQHTATHCNTLPTHCNTLQHTATHCNTLPTHCNTLRKWRCQRQ